MQAASRSTTVGSGHRSTLASAWNADGTVAPRTPTLLSVRLTPLLSTNWHADTEIWSSMHSMSRTAAT